MELAAERNPVRDERDNLGEPSAQISLNLFNRFDEIWADDPFALKGRSMTQMYNYCAICT